MTAGFHNTIYLHGPHAPTVHWVESSPAGWASVQTSGANLLVKTVAEADELIKAAVAAKDLLLAAQAPCSTPALHRASRCACHGISWTDTPAAEHAQAVREAMLLPLDVSGDLDAIPANRIGEPAPLPPEHGPNHIDNAGHATLACDGTCDPACVNCATAGATS